MKNKKNVELDVDFIGGEGDLTKEEEMAISNYIAAKKQETKNDSGKRAKKFALPAAIVKHT